MTTTPDLNREIATTADGIDITRGYTGPLLQPYDSVLRTRGNGDLIIYEQVFSDPEVKSTFAQRQLAVTQCEWQVDAGGERPIDVEAADFLRAQLNNVGWDNITTKMLTGVFFGFAVAEVIYQRVDNRIGFKAIKVRNRRRFRFGKEGELRLLTMNNMTHGVPAEAPYFWSFNTGADNDDEPYGLGLAHWLYWPVLFKRNGMKFWLIFLEKFGMPTAVGEYEAEATATERAALLGATRAIQVDSGVIIPKGMKLTLLEAARSGTADYKTLQEVMDATIQKVTLGQTASTQGTKGRLGNDDLQADVREDIIKADADLICESFNQGPARWLTEFNFPGAAIPKVYRVTEEPEDLDSAVKRDEALTRIGFKPTLAHVEKTYGGDRVETQPAVPGTGTALEGGQFAEPIGSVRELLQRHGLRFAEPAPLAVAPSLAIAQRLDSAAQPHIDGWVDKLEQLVVNSEATTLADLRDEIVAAYADLPDEELAAVLAQALMASTAAGRYDIAESDNG